MHLTPPTRRTGFGLAIELHDGIVCDGLLAEADAGGLSPPTQVRIAPPESIDAAWPPGGSVLTREVRARDRLVFDVRYAPGVGYLLRLPGYGRFLIDEAGLSVLCEPGRAEGWEGGLAIQALPIACTLRALEPFHASGVVLGGRAYLITGPVTAGKSSLAAHLVQLGATLLSDDVVTLQSGPDGTILAHSGERWVHLRPPEDERLRTVADPRLEPAGVRDGRQRFSAPLEVGPHPLEAIYLLGPAEEDGMQIQRIQATAPALLGATYNLSVRDPQRLRRQFELAQRLAANVPVHRVAVSRQGSAAALARDLLDHTERSG